MAQTRVAAKLPRMTNAFIWDAIRAKFPQFASHTSEATADMFTDRGFDALKQSDPSALNDFFGLSIRVYLNEVNISHAADRLAENDFGESFQTPYGGMIQRLATYSIKPISPQYRNITNGASVDPFVVRKPESAERFWKQNFDYQSLVTVQDDFQMKTIFISEYGMSEYMAGILQGMENGWTVQKYENKLETLNAAMHSTEWPMQDTQNVDVAIADMANPTDTELRNLALAIMNVRSAMLIGPQTSAFNPAKFGSVQDENRLKLLVRPGFKNVMNTNLLYGVYNPDRLNLNVDIIEVPHFGGLKPTSDGSTPVYPVYDKLGTITGFATTASAATPTIDFQAVKWVDPNANVIAMLADKGMIFEGIQNAYEVRPIQNPAGLYTNYWASAPGNFIGWDPIYNFVTFTRTTN